MKTTSTALHDVRLNQIVRCAGVKFSSFFQHLTKLQDVFPNLFQHHLDQVSNFKLQYLYCTFLHEKWRELWTMRDKIAVAGIVAKRGKRELETKLQHFSWILFMM